MTNLDEFFMIRVAGVHDQVDARIDARGPDGLPPTEVLREIHTTVREQDRRHARQLTQNLMPELAEQGIRIVSCEESGAPAEAIEKHFREQIFPVLTPLAVSAGRRPVHLQPVAEPDRPPPRSGLRPRRLRPGQGPKEVLPRFVEIARDTFIPLEDVIASNFDTLFPGMRILSYDFFRVTRDAEFEVSDEADDLLQAVEDELRRRRFGEVPA